MLHKKLLAPEWFRTLEIQCSSPEEKNNKKIVDKSLISKSTKTSVAKTKQKLKTLQ